LTWKKKAFKKLSERKRDKLMRAVDGNEDEVAMVERSRVFAKVGHPEIEAFFTDVFRGVGDLVLIPEESDGENRVFRVRPKRLGDVYRVAVCFRALEKAY
jgi:hypothetical protein